MKRAFTLIELLVVIAIIAILAAILFPVFAQAKEAAKKTTGISHLKQQNLSTLMYAGDYDDVYPLAVRAMDNGNASVWIFDVFPYTKNYDLFLNPQGQPHPSTDINWKYIGGTYGTMPNASIKALPYYTAGDWPITRALGVVGVRHNGIMGVFNWRAGDPLFGRGCFGRCDWNAPSRAQSSLPNVAGFALIFDAGEPTADYTTFQAGAELGTCADRTAYSPGGASIAGATPRWNGGPKTCNGWRNPGSAGISVENANKVRNGQANIGFADGSVKSMSLPQLYRFQPCEGSASTNCMVHFPVD